MADTDAEHVIDREVDTFYRDLVPTAVNELYSKLDEKIDSKFEQILVIMKMTPPYFLRMYVHFRRSVELPPQCVVSSSR